MKRHEFLDRLDHLNVWKRVGQRAPHKPLLLLLALGRVLAGEPRLGGYRDDIDGPLGDLLDRFGPPRRAHHPELPFVHLRSDGLWEIPKHEPMTPRGAVDKRRLVERNVPGGLPQSVHALLQADRALVQQAAKRLLDGHFPASLHDDIRRAVGIPRDAVLRDAALARDPAFRRDVLRVYERRCAVCDFDVRLGNDPIGLEAAHIKWHAAGGPDAVPNGLALCGFHHKAFDRGALGLTAAAGGDYVVLISSEVNGLSAPVRWLLDFHAKPLRRPQSPDYTPDPAFVDWHRREVFRSPARAAPGEVGGDL